MANVARTLKEWIEYANKLEAALGADHPRVIKLRSLIISEKLKRAELRHMERTNPLKAHIIRRLRNMPKPK